MTTKGIQAYFSWFRFGCKQASLDVLSTLSYLFPDRYTSQEFQNELLMLMSKARFEVVVGNIQQADFFTIMADECADDAKEEQLILCPRYIDIDVTCYVHE